MAIAALESQTRELDAPRVVLARVGGLRRAADAAEVAILVSAAKWADLHPVVPRPDGSWPAGALSGHEGAGDLPDLAWDAPAALAAALGMSTDSGARLIHDALELRHRLPRIWARLLDGDLPAWRARRIAQTAHGAPPDVAAYLDQHLAGVAHRVGVVVLDRLLDEAMLRLHPEERELAQFERLEARHVRVYADQPGHTGIVDIAIRADLKDAYDFDATLAQVAAALAADGCAESLDVRRSMAIGVLADPEGALDLLTTHTQEPTDAERVTDTARTDPAAGSGEPRPRRTPRKRVALVVHLSAEAVTGWEPVGRCETGGGAGAPVLVQQVRDWCGRPDTQVTVQPVIDLADQVAVTAYEVPDRLRTRLSLRDHTCVFPWCTRAARACDSDHIVPHARGGPTSDENLAPLCRRHHRLKTGAGWAYTALEPGVFLWTSPHGQQFLRDHHGTLDVTPDRRPHAPADVGGRVSEGRGPFGSGPPHLRRAPGREHGGG